MYQIQKGSTFCLPCLTGKFQNEPGKSDCKVCPIGYSNGGTEATECTKCKEGRYNEQEKQAACKGCPAGTYSTEEGLDAEIKCSTCNAGTYSKAIGATSKDTCIDCQPGKKGTEIGASNEKACSDCGPEEYRGVRDDATTCLKCPSGRSSSNGSVVCSVCSAGQYVETSTDSCIICPKGYVSKNQNSKVCGQCGIGIKGENSEAGDTSCSSCDLGMFQTTPGVCQDCTPGQYADGKGQKSCTQCPVDTYLSESGKSSKAECSPCAADRSTGDAIGNIDNSACLCKRTDFYTDTTDDTNTDEGACVSCPVGADCSAKDGLMLAELTAKPGYWRPSLDSEFFSPCVAGYSTLNAQDLANQRCCPVVVDATTNVSICVRNSSTTTTTFVHTDEQCRYGYSGSLCLVCAAGFVKQGTDCIACPEGASIGIAAIPLISMLVGLFIVLLIFMVCGKKAQNNAKKANKWFGQAKIMLSFLQMFSSMPGVLDGVPWPKPFLEFSLPLGLANLDFLSVLAKTGCSLNVRFYDKFILHMILPVGCLAMIVIAYFAALTCCVKKNDTPRQSSVKETSSKAVILVVLLLYPGLST